MTNKENREYELASEIQEIARKIIGRKLTALDIRMYSVLNKSQVAKSNIADNRYFDEDAERILRELHSIGHISYDGLNIRIKRSFYEFMLSALEKAPREDIVP